MRYVQFAVPARVAPWVECIWRLTGAADADAPGHRVFPDGCLEIVVHAGDPFRERWDDGATRRQPTRLVVGQMLRPVTLEPMGAIDVWGVRVHPWGAGLLFDGPIAELTDRIEEAGGVAPALTRALERAVAAPSEEARVDAIRAALCERARRVAEPDGIARQVARQLLREPAGASVTQLAHGIGLSVRQLERRFLARVGLTPARFARIARFQQVCTLLEAEPETLAATAVRCGYYDQSHLARDVRDFAGLTPAALRALDSSITEEFLRRRRSIPG